MEDDDEFGDLYTDVLRPASTASKPPPPPLRSENSDDGRRDRVFLGARSGSPPSPPPSQLPAQSVVLDAREGGDEDWVDGRGPIAEEQASDWSNREDEGLPRVSRGKATGLLPRQGGVASVLMEEEEEVAAGLVEAPREEVGGDEEGVGVAEDVGAFVRGREAVVTPDVDDGPADLDQEPVIPGLSVGSVLPSVIDGTEGGDAKVSRSDDWDSDSEDDLQIVLNDDNLGSPVGNKNVAAGVEDDDDEDGEDDLVIVTDEDQQQHHPHHQGVEEQDRGEESMQQPLDGERKEKSDGTRGNGEIGPVGMAKIGYSSHGCHGQQHSQFKYIRPGVATIPGGASVGNAAASGQVHPPHTMGPIAGRGRGAQKGFHSGYGLILWSSGTSARAYGGGLEFTLPSHKTIFEIDIDDFEEKPWRLPGVDTSDFFNFGLNEERWRVFCKQLEQLRLEATMQSKICVYESGRCEKDYDPDLPPELAAATGLHGNSGESTQHGKADSEQADFIGQGRGPLCLRPQVPIGRAIQVESSFGERLPSIDTRPPRLRDSGAIIEIVLHDSVDVCSGPLNRQPCEPQGQDAEGDHEDEDDGRHADSEHLNHFPPACNGGKRVVTKRKGSPMVSIDNNVIEGNGILPFPSDASSNYLTDSKSETPMIAGDHYVASRTSRRTQSNASAECSNDAISSQSVELQIHDVQKETSGDGMEDEVIMDIPPVAPPNPAVEVRLEKRSDEHNDKFALDDDAEIGKEEMASDLRLSGEFHGDNAPYYAVKKQKLSSRVEQLAVQDKDDGGDSRATHSDNSRVKSGSSKDYLKRHESGEEEVMQSRRTRQIGDMTGHHHEERSFHQKDDYGRDGRHDMNRSHVTSKQREDMYQSHLHRERDSTNYGRKDETFEGGKERNDSFGGCLRREDDAYGRRGKDEDRKQDHDDEMGSIHRNKVRVSERKGKDVDLHSRKHIGDGDRKGHDRVGATRQRERDSISMSGRENFDDLRVRRRKDEEQTRREKVAKKDALHVRKGMEGSTQGKREKDNGANKKGREDQTSVRDKIENHFTKHRDDNLRHKEREDRRLNKLNEDVHTRKKREEGHTVVKGGRVLDDKRVGEIERVNGVSKGLGLDDYPPKDRRRQSEHHRGGDHIDEHIHHKARQKMCPHENQATNREKDLKNERCSSHSNHPSVASDDQQVCRERHRENSRKNKESKGGQTSFLAARKRKQHQICHLNEKVSAKGANEQEGRNLPSGLLSKKGHHLTAKPSDVQKQHHSPGNRAEEDVASDDDSYHNARRGRSKLERWTSHKERDYSNSSPQRLPSSSRARESRVSNVDIIPLGDSIKNEDCNNVDSNAKDAEAMQIDHVEEELDCHHDTVAKLKRRSEQFEDPMPGEDPMMTKNPEIEVPLIQSETVADAEIKEERATKKSEPLARGVGLVS